MKSRFFKFDQDSKKFLLADTNLFNKKKKIIDINAILSINYGIASNNLREKEKDFTRKKFIYQPWLFFSLVLKDKTFDLFVDQDDEINKTMLGLSIAKEINKFNYKIMKRADFLLKKFKLKLVIAKIGRAHV